MTNARKSRERHKLEQQSQAEKEFEAEQRKIMVENYQVFSCSGTQTHDQECDGNCEVETLDELDIQIADESKRWEELDMVYVGKPPGLPIPGIPIDTFHLETAFQALLRLVEEKDIATREEMDQMFKVVKLERMTTIRERNEEAIIEARRRQRIAVTSEMPQIEIPGQYKRKMQ